MCSFHFREICPSVCYIYLYLSVFYFYIALSPHVLYNLFSICYFLICTPECKPTQDILFCLPLYPQHLNKCLTYNRGQLLYKESISIIYRNLINLKRVCRIYLFNNISSYYVNINIFKLQHLKDLMQIIKVSFIFLTQDCQKTKRPSLFESLTSIQMCSMLGSVYTE